MQQLYPLAGIVEGILIRAIQKFEVKLQFGFDGSVHTAQLVPKGSNMPPIIADDESLHGFIFVDDTLHAIVHDV